MIRPSLLSRRVGQLASQRSTLRIGSRGFATELSTADGQPGAASQALQASETVIEPILDPAEASASNTSLDDDPEAINKRIVEDFLRTKFLKQHFSGIGTVVETAYRPSELVNNPYSVQDVTLELLLASQTHFGHSKAIWHPSNARYICGIRAGTHIISLDVTAAHLRRAARVVSAVAEHGGLVLFVGSRPGQRRCIVKAAELAGGYHVFNRWLSGTITNGPRVLAKGQLKVVDEFDNELPGYDEQFYTRGVMKPDLVVCLNPRENAVLLKECGQHRIPTIGIIDTNTNPAWVTYPIPANDDSLRSVQLIAGVLGRAGETGQKRRRALAEKGIIPYPKDRELGPPSRKKADLDD